MSVALREERTTRHIPTGVMKANVFRTPGRFGIEQKPIPVPGAGEAVIRVSLTTLCETDLHILRGDYPVAAGLTLGHEAVGILHELGAGVTGYECGQRILVGAITPCGQCESCLGGHTSQCGGPLGGWRLGNTLDGTQAEYVLIPHAQANLAVVPNTLSDEQVLLLAHVASTGFAAAEQANIKLGDTVVVFSHGTVGLCAALGARLRGAGEIIAASDDPAYLALALQYGATATVDTREDPTAKILSITGNRGVDVACIEMTAMPGGEGKIRGNIESASCALRPGGTLLSVGVSCGHLQAPSSTHNPRKERSIVTPLCPGGKERMLRLMRLVRAHRVDLSPLITHLFTLDEIVEACELFESGRHGVLKVGIRVS